MKPNNPLQVLKAAARYASIPIKRFNPSSNGKMLALAPREQWKNIQSLHPQEKILFRTLNVSQFEFRMSLAPWLLQDRNFTIIAMGKSQEFIEDFCRRHKGNYVRMDIPVIKKTKNNEFVASNSTAVPSWYRVYPSVDLKNSIDSNKPVFLYFPWIAEHGDAIMENIKCDDYSLSAFDVISDVNDNEIRREVFRFARYNPETYRRMVIRRLAPIASKISGFVFTFDWAPVTRIIVEACRSLNIPTILIPHESVFIDADLYYKDLVSHSSRPVTDYVLAWGDLQTSIFTERGYDTKRIIKVGAPKFDDYSNNNTLILKSNFYDLYSLKHNLKTILFATQPLDSQTDMDLARDAQRAAISDLVRYVEDNNHQLIVRLPPSKDDILGEQLRAILEASPFCAIDDAHFYLLPPHEVIKHVDAVASINSTMLFEGVLAGKQAIAMRYIAFDSIWDQVGINVAHNLTDAAKILDATFTGEGVLPPPNMQWAASQFGIGTFDGQASMRIKQFLIQLSDGTDIRQPPLVEYMTSATPLDVLGIPAYPELKNITNEQLRRLLGANTLVRFNKTPKEETTRLLSGVDALVQWGKSDSAPNIVLQTTARTLGKKILYLDSGLVRVPDTVALSPLGASIIVDDQAPHYETRLPSRLEDRLQHGAALTPEQERYARAAVALLYATPNSDNTPSASSDAPAVLIIDQSQSDPYFSRNAVTFADFETMVCDALKDWPNRTIYIYREAGDDGHLSQSRLLNAGIASEHIRFLEHTSAPHELFANTEAVYTVSSKLGFEALLSGKSVTCYGQPFYSGWGLTADKQPMARRTRQRSVLDIFHYACVDAARYADPQTDEQIDLQSFLSRMSEV